MFVCFTHGINDFSLRIILSASTFGKSLELISFLLTQPGVDINCQGQDGHTGISFETCS